MNEAGREIVISARKDRALLAELAVSPSGSVSREKLAALLWSDRGENQARSSLRQSLTVLRKELGPLGANLLIADDQRVELTRDAMEIDAVSIISQSKKRIHRHFAVRQICIRGNSLPTEKLAIRCLKNGLPAPRQPSILQFAAERTLAL